MSTERLALAFQAALGLTCIFVTASSGRIRIGRATDPAAALKRLRKNDPAAELLTAGWCRADRAEMLLMSIEDRAPAEAGEACRHIVAAAEELGLVLQTDAEVRDLAEAAAARVEATFEAMRRSGDLRSLNARYRAARLARTATGAGMVSYSRWVEMQKIALAVAAAEAAASSAALVGRL